MKLLKIITAGLVGYIITDQLHPQQAIAQPCDTLTPLCWQYGGPGDYYAPNRLNFRFFNRGGYQVVDRYEPANAFNRLQTDLPAIGMPAPFRPGDKFKFLDNTNKIGSLPLEFIASDDALFKDPAPHILKYDSAPGWGRALASGRTIPHSENPLAPWLAKTSVSMMVEDFVDVEPDLNYSQFVFSSSSRFSLLPNPMTLGLASSFSGVIQHIAPTGFVNISAIGSIELPTISFPNANPIPSPIFFAYSMYYDPQVGINFRNTNDFLGELWNIAPDLPYKLMPNSHELAISNNSFIGYNNAPVMVGDSPIFFSTSALRIQDILQLQLVEPITYNLVLSLNVKDATVVFDDTAFDFGDLPDSYKTLDKGGLASQGGPRYKSKVAGFLGRDFLKSWDDEADSLIKWHRQDDDSLQPLLSIDDEDGIEFLPNAIDATMTFNLDGNYNFSGWWDLNEDGSFDHILERIIDDNINAFAGVGISRYPLGFNPYKFPSRFRLTYIDDPLGLRGGVSLNTDILPIGEYKAANMLSFGEVEDYYPVPGPIPFMGIGVAVTWARKLRKLRTMSKMLSKDAAGFIA